MPIDNDRIQALLERADPTMKLKRLEKELDGDGEQIGLREQLLVATHALENQQRLAKRRESQRDDIDELARDIYDQNLAEINMYLTFYEGQVEDHADQIEEKEKAIEALTSAGTVSNPKPATNRAGRRR